MKTSDFVWLGVIIVLATYISGIGTYRWIKRDQELILSRKNNPIN